MILSGRTDSSCDSSFFVGLKNKVSECNSLAQDKDFRTYTFKLSIQDFLDSVALNCHPSRYDLNFLNDLMADYTTNIVILTANRRWIDSVYEVREGYWSIFFSAYVSGFNTKTDSWVNNAYGDLRYNSKLFDYFDEYLENEINRRLTQIVKLSLGTEIDDKYVVKFSTITF